MLAFACNVNPESAALTLFDFIVKGDVGPVVPIPTLPALVILNLSKFSTPSLVVVNIKSGLTP